LNLYGFVGNDGVNWIDYIGMLIVTQEGQSYRKKVLDCLKCCGKYEWFLDEKIRRTPGKLVDTFEKHKPWYRLKLKDGFKGTRRGQVITLAICLTNNCEAPFRFSLVWALPRWD